MLGACAWIKADGLLIWLVVTALWLLLATQKDRRLALAASLTSALLWIVPWHCWLAFKCVGIGDFSITQIWTRNWHDHADVLVTVGQRLLKLMNAHGGTYAWWWWLLLGALLLRGESIWRQRGLRLMLLAGMGFLAAFCGTYLCSTLPLDWHMNSLYRLLAMLQPWMLAVAAAMLAASNEHRNACSEGGIIIASQGMTTLMSSQMLDFTEWLECRQSSG